MIGFTADDIVGGGQDVRLAAAYARARQGTEEPVDARIVQAPGDRDHVLVWFVDEAAARILDAAAEPGTAWWHSVGTAVRIVGAARTSCCDRWIAELYGIERVRVIAPCQLRPFVTARCVLLDDPVEDPLHLQALARAIAELAARIARRFPHCFHVARARERLSAVEAPREDLGGRAIECPSRECRRPPSRVHRARPRITRDDQLRVR
jgi:hypothetical protein